jgi:hypothetical protein
MQRHTNAVNFCEITHYGPKKADGLTFAIRTDAHFATRHLKSRLLEHFRPTFHDEMELLAHAMEVKKDVHGAYRIWGHDVLKAMGDCVNYGTYGLPDDYQGRLNVHFYDCRNLATETLKKADMLVRLSPYAEIGVPPVYISLDNMIDAPRTHVAEIGLSRLFCARGQNRKDYVARPGTPPLEEQVAVVHSRIEKLSKEHGGLPVPIVLLEDNVRHASMINMIVSKLEEGGVMERGRLLGIATGFCCATPEERAAITYGGSKVPLGIAVDYKAALVDVITPRDLLFDGIVVQAGNRITRMPAVVMDLEKRFRIHPDRQEEFRERVVEANSDFCERVERKFGFTLPLSWLVDVDALPYADPEKGAEVQKSGVGVRRLSLVRPQPAA